MPLATLCDAVQAAEVSVVKRSVQLDDLLPGRARSSEFTSAQAIVDSLRAARLGGTISEEQCMELIEQPIVNDVWARAVRLLAGNAGPELQVINAEHQMRGVIRCLAHEHDDPTLLTAPSAQEIKRVAEQKVQVYRALAEAKAMHIFAEAVPGPKEIDGVRKVVLDKFPDGTIPAHLSAVQEDIVYRTPVAWLFAVLNRDVELHPMMTAAQETEYVKLMEKNLSKCEVLALKTAYRERCLFENAAHVIKQHGCEVRVFATIGAGHLISEGDFLDPEYAPRIEVLKFPVADPAVLSEAAGILLRQQSFSEPETGPATLLESSWREILTRGVVSFDIKLLPQLPRGELQSALLQNSYTVFEEWRGNPDALLAFILVEAKSPEVAQEAQTLRNRRGGCFSAFSDEEIVRRFWHAKHSPELQRRLVSCLPEELMPTTFRKIADNLSDDDARRVLEERVRLEILKGGGTPQK